MLLKVSYSPPSGEVVVAFNYAPDYVARIKKIPGARYRPESKLWQVPLENFEILEDLFKGEIVYDTPRRVITGEPEVDYHRDIVPVESIPTAVPLYGFQKFGASFLARRARGKGFAFLCDATGIGKGHPVDTKVLTPTGWRRIGDLRVGDKVIGSDGRAVTVIGVFRRGILPVYRVTFNDGCSVLVDADHVWAVRTNGEQHQDRGFHLKTTRELMTDLTYSNGYCKWRIPLVAPVQFEDSDQRPIDPYILGVLLADGCLNGHSVRFTPGDPRVADEVASILPPGLVLSKTKRPKRPSSSAYYISSGKTGAPNPVLTALRQLGLMGLRSHERFVPQSYLFAPVEDRIALLQGLMDSDGEFNPRTNHVGYCTTSPYLADALTFLVRSLGGMVYRRVKHSPRYRHNGELRNGKSAYLLTIRLPNHILPFRVRKQPYLERLKSRKYLPNRIIRSIEPAGEAEAVCIAVDAPDQLYVTEHFVVTHNSPQSLGARLLLMQALGIDSLPTLVVAPAAVRHQWVADAVPKFLGDSASVVEVEGDQNHRLKLYGAAEITVVNYEALMRDVDLLPKKLKFGLVILDECQKVKNRLGKTHRALKKLLKRMPGMFRFLLTATPVMNDLDELYALFDLACPGFFGKYGEFRERYMRIDYSQGYPKLVGYRRLDELSAKIGPYILRRTPSHPEVASSLPEMVAQNLYVEPDREQKRLHDILYDEWCRAMDERAAAGEDIERLEALCRGYITLMQGAADDPRLFLMSGSGMVKKYAALCSKAGGPSPKLKLLADLAEDLAPQGKMLVFSRFERMVQLAAQVLEKYRPAIFTGKNKNFRDSELGRFRNDPACRVMLATDAGGVGLNLQVARYVVNLDLPWSPGQLEQRYGRVKRFGSGHDKVLAVNLIARGTIDERILAALERKEDITKTVICER